MAFGHGAKPGSNIQIRSYLASHGGEILHGCLDAGPAMRPQPDRLGMKEVLPAGA
jgi:hypothetical protein